MLENARLGAETYANRWGHSPSASSAGSCPAPADGRSWPPFDTVIDRGRTRKQQTTCPVSQLRGGQTDNMRPVAHSQTPCIVGSRHIASRLHPRSRRSSRPLCCLQRGHVHAQKAATTIMRRCGAWKQSTDRHTPFIFVKSNHVMYPLASSHSLSRWIVACASH